MRERGVDYWNGPAAVVIEYHDGRRDYLTFSTRIEAEQWVALLPWLQAERARADTGSAAEDERAIRSAQLAETGVLRPEEVVAALSWN